MVARSVPSSAPSMGTQRWQKIRRDEGPSLGPVFHKSVTTGNLDHSPSYKSYSYV